MTKIANKIFKLQQKIDGMKSDKKGHGFNYSSVPAIMKAFDEANKELKLALVWSVEDGRLEPIETKDKNGTHKEYAVGSKVILKVIDSESGEFVEYSEYFYDNDKSTSYASGGKNTYATRYLMFKLFGVMSEDADPNARTYTGRSTFDRNKWIETFSNHKEQEKLKAKYNEIAKEMGENNWFQWDRVKNNVLEKLVEAASKK